MNKIFEIILNHTTFDLKENKQKFIESFEQLYQLPILRQTLNLVATKANHDEIKFVIEVSKVWNRLAGHCQTEGFMSKLGNIIFQRNKHIITIKTITPDVIIHEIAHAIEKESNLNLNDEFRKVLAIDMKNTESAHPNVFNAVNTVMKDELKGYDLKNIISELFARYFELLAMSYECGGYGRFHFHYDDIEKFFINTTNWVHKKLNPILSKKIDDNIKSFSNELVDELKPYEKKWSNENQSRYDKTMKSNSLGKWTGTTKSNWDYQKSYEKYKKNQIEKENKLLDE